MDGDSGEHRRPEFGHGSVAESANDVAEAASFGGSSKETAHEGNHLSRRRSLVTELLIAAGCVAVAAAGTWWINTANSGAPYSRGALLADESSLDFGEVWVSDQFRWILPIANLSDVAVSIEGVTTSCGCVAVEPHQATLGPGERIDLHLLLDLSTVDPAEASRDVRPFEVDVTAHTDYGTHPSWRLSGRVRSAITVTPTIVDFGGALVYATEHPPREIEIACREPGVKVVATSGRHVSVSLSETERGYTALVTPVKDLPNGLFKDTLILSANSPGGESLGRIPVHISGTVIHDIESTPPELILGTVFRGEQREDVLLLSSRTATPFEVVGIGSDCPGVRFEAEPGRVSSEVVVTLALQDLAEGQCSGDVNVDVRYRGGKRSTVTIPISFRRAK